MEASLAAEELTELTHSIEGQLSALQRQLEKLKHCKTVLHQQHNKKLQDRGTQADVGPTINPLRHVRRMEHGVPFAFQPPTRKLNWKRLRQIDVQNMAEASDAPAAMQLFEDVAYGDVEAGSIYDLSEANLIKANHQAGSAAVHAVLQLQFMQYKLEEKVEAEHALEDDSLALAAGLSGLTAPSFTDIHRGLGFLESDLQQLGRSRVDGVIEQVRVEERQAARSALMEAIQKTRQQVDVKYGLAVGGEQPNSTS